MNHSYRCWAEIDLEALRSNLAWIRHRAGRGVQIMTVVKADAYGHGLKQICSSLMQGGTDWFGVANLSEAAVVHGVGSGWPVLLLSSSLPEEVDEVIRSGIRATVSSLAEAKAYSRASVVLQRTSRIHIKIDTGMGRLGTVHGDAMKLIKAASRLPGIEIEGVFTHFSSVEDDPDWTAIQLQRFEEIVGGLNSIGVAIPVVHAANSGGLIHESSARYNLIRPGLLTYGVVPEGRRPLKPDIGKQIQPVLSWKCRVSLVKTLAKESRISYGGTFVAPRKIKVAILTAGYGDGYSRVGSDRKVVLIRGQRCRVLGRITMDQVIVDVSRLKGISPGEEAVLIGRQGQQQISVSDVANWRGTIPWEVFTGITCRVPRIYKGGTAA
ncbi:MAG: alanine racemase [Opitutaceae bacterium]|nr:alanine racemase [Verrucomicrobiales bacterium]